MTPKRFSATDPLGLNLDDVEHLNEMPEQRMLEVGVIDVTAPPFSSDPTGATDSTRAIADAIFFGRHHKLAVYFPAGDYLVSDTIPCRAGWSDERLPNHPYLPYTEMWPCVLLGDRRSEKRARIVLAPNSPGFGNPEAPKVVLDFDARHWHRADRNLPLSARNGATNYNQLLCGVDAMIGKGNPGAAAVSFDAAESSTLQDSVLEVGDGYCGLLHGPGSGGAIFNLTFRGGQFGALMGCPRPMATLVACRFSGQRVAAVDYSQRGALTLVGCEFDMPAGTTAVHSWSGDQGRNTSSVSVVDCRIAYEKASEKTAAFTADTAFYVRNCWVRNAPIIVLAQAGKASSPRESEWVHIAELACAHQYTQEMSAPIYIDGERSMGFHGNMKPSEAPPEDLRSRHVWDEATFPAWDRPGMVSVKATPYSAVGDGQTDDTDALQRAIDENETLFLPKGAYKITKTLRLKARTKIIGLSPSYCMIVPMPAEGGDFTDYRNPKPALQTAETADAKTILAFFMVFMPREISCASYVVNWGCGGKSIARCVFASTGYTENGIEPLGKGIYPWANWKWGDFEFPLALGPFKHYSHSPLGGDDVEEGVPNWPLVRVYGNGAGGWYPHSALDGREQGRKRRRFLIENAAGPFSIYHAQFQLCKGAAEIEIAHSRNVAIYGIKNENDSLALWAHDSTGVLMTGLGGPGTHSDNGKFLIENSGDVTLANLIDDYFCLSGNRGPKGGVANPLVIECLPDGTERKTAPHDRPVLYKTASSDADGRIQA